MNNIFFRKLKTAKNVYFEKGIYDFFIHLLNNIGIKTKFQSFLDKRKYIIDKKIIKLTNNLVSHGPYKNTFFNCKSNWGAHDFSSKLLGLYEKQIQEKSIEIQKKYNLKNIVNFGAADGYHLISLINNNFFEKGLAFEIDKITKEILEDNIKKNNLLDKIKIFDKADLNIVNKNLNNDDLEKTLFLVDIEGGEFELFDNIDLAMFKKSFFIIEYHEANEKSDEKITKFNKLINLNFQVSTIENSPRNPFSSDLIDNFHDDERWLIMSESRARRMKWFLLQPKN